MTSLSIKRCFDLNDDDDDDCKNAKSAVISYFQATLKSQSETIERQKEVIFRLERRDHERETELQNTKDKMRALEVFIDERVSSYVV